MAAPTPDVSKSSMSVSATQCPVGSFIEVHLSLRGARGNPMVGPGIMNSVDGIVVLPCGKMVRIEFPHQVPAGGVCKTKIVLGAIGVHKVHVKICGVDMKQSPVKVAAILRGTLIGTYKPPMNQPHDVIMRENVFMVTDKGNNQVQVFDKTFRPANKFCTPAVGKFDPYAIAWTGDSFVVTDVTNHCVVEFKNFVPFRVFGQETVQQPCGIAVGKNGCVYVADGMKHCIFVFDQNRQCTSIIGGHGTSLGKLDTPWFMAMNSRNNLVVAEFKNHRIQVFNPEKNQPVRIIDVKHNGKTWDCRGLAVDHNDNIYVTIRSGFMRGFSTETVVVYSPTGEFLGNFGEGFNYVRGLTVTKQGQKTIAYVVDGANNRILAYEM